MENEDSGSIFDEASAMARKKRLLKKKKKRPPSPPASKPSATATQPNLDDEAVSMLNRMRQLRNDLEGKMLDLYSVAGVSSTIVEEFFSNPRNLPPEKKEAIEKDVAKLETELSDVLGKRAKRVSQKFQESKQSDKRKKKSIGQRRKWLQM